MYVDALHTIKRVCPSKACLQINIQCDLAKQGFLEYSIVECFSEDQPMNIGLSHVIGGLSDITFAQCFFER